MNNYFILFFKKLCYLIPIIVIYNLVRYENITLFNIYFVILLIYNTYTLFVLKKYKNKRFLIPGVITYFLGIVYFLIE